MDKYYRVENQSPEYTELLIEYDYMRKQVEQQGETIRQYRQEIKDLYVKNKNAIMFNDDRLEELKKCFDRNKQKTKEIRSLRQQNNALQQRIIELESLLNVSSDTIRTARRPRSIS